MAELATDEDLPQTPGRPAPARPAITSISQWVERFSLMASVLATRFPEKAPEFFAYQATIVRAERNYEGNRWVVYDRQFRREALARKDLNWSVTDPRLYNEAFTGRAKCIARCSYCLQDDHSASACPRNPNRPFLGWYPDVSTWPAAMHGPPQRLPLGGPTQEVCRRFNEQKCKFARCKYGHVCLQCGGPHPRRECTQRSRSRSPLRSHGQGPQGSRH